MITRLFPFYNESAVVLVLPVRFKETEILNIALRKKNITKINTMQKENEMKQNYQYSIFLTTC